MGKRSRRVGFVVGAAMAVLALGTATAWACVALASVELNPGQAASGTKTTAKLSGFQTTDPTYSAVELHWGGANGPVLASMSGVQLTASGNKMTFTVPASDPGSYVVVATQYDSSGSPAWGTPARATLTVPGRAAGTAPTEAAPEPEVVTVEQKYVIDQAPSAPVVQPGTPVRPLEDLEGLDQVAPSSSRDVRYVPASERRSPSTVPFRAGLGLAAAGAMALLTAASAVVIVRRNTSDITSSRIR